MKITGFFYNSDKPKILVNVFDVVERLLFAVAGLLCVIPESRTDLVGIIMLAVLIAYQLATKKIRLKKAAA